MANHVVEYLKQVEKEVSDPALVEDVDEDWPRNASLGARRDREP
jgi:hypothetical protein